MTASATVPLEYVSTTLKIPYYKVLNLIAGRGVKFPRSCGKNAQRQTVYDKAAVDLWIQSRWVKNGRGYQRIKRQGFVYFIACRRCVKIGYATDVAERILALQTANPFKLTLLAMVPVRGQRGERLLHKRFRKYRVRGGGTEWFRLVPEIVEYIASIQQAIATSEERPPNGI